MMAVNVVVAIRSKMQQASDVDLLRGFFGALKHKRDDLQMLTEVHALDALLLAASWQV